MVVELCVLCLYVNLKLCVFFAELGLEDFPPLTPPSLSPWSPTKKQLYAMISEVKAHLVAMEGDLKEFKVLGHHWSKNDLILCAAEILKWSVNLRGEECSDGKQFFRDDLFVPVVVSI
jgi:hypothetical protein